MRRICSDRVRNTLTSTEVGNWTETPNPQSFTAVRNTLTSTEVGNTYKPPVLFYWYNPVRNTLTSTEVGN